MADKLKNCPSCGGTLNDDGRCPYCNSKVYDLSDINIDVGSRDVVKLKIKMGENTMVLDCYPANLSWNTDYDTLDVGRLGDETMCMIRGRTTHRITLELVTM